MAQCSDKCVELDGTGGKSHCKGFNYYTETKVSGPVQKCVPWRETKRISTATNIGGHSTKSNSFFYNILSEYTDLPMSGFNFCLGSQRISPTLASAFLIRQGTGAETVSRVACEAACTSEPLCISWNWYTKYSVSNGALRTSHCSLFNAAASTASVIGDYSKYADGDGEPNFWYGDSFFHSNQA
ncbi:hypothetical protein DRE_04817 [Drechslerella stenobrocha 248]|uniref:Uncharacterized protein n=1 Tax=Drechslerella stenobrocha 248 TaxID=1043628 RepID=W7HS71_9PEZI|nr:hypothetical protein DRE_04817 [Drechslerella stenobrocha 248]